MGFYPVDLYAPEWDTQSIYYPLRQQPETSFPVWDKSGRLPEKSEVLGLIVGGEARAYTAEVLRQQTVLNDTLGGSCLVVITPGDRTGSRAFQRNGQGFAAISQGGIGAAEVFVADSDGGGWRMDEDARVKTRDPFQRLKILPSHVAYWFGWYGFHSATGIYGQD
jgi:hypothetical protein